MANKLRSHIHTVNFEFNSSNSQTAIKHINQIQSPKNSNYAYLIELTALHCQEAETQQQNNQQTTQYFHKISQSKSNLTNLKLEKTKTELAHTHTPLYEAYHRQIQSQSCYETPAKRCSY